MVAEGKVVVVIAIVVAPVNPELADFSHLMTEPVWPLRVRSAGADPEQIVCAPATVPPIETGFIVAITG